MYDISEAILGDLESSGSVEGGIYIGALAQEDRKRLCSVKSQLVIKSV